MKFDDLMFESAGCDCAHRRAVHHRADGITLVITTAEDEHYTVVSMRDDLVVELPRVVDRPALESLLT